MISLLLSAVLSLYTSADGPVEMVTWTDLMMQSAYAQDDGGPEDNDFSGDEGSDPSDLPPGEDAPPADGSSGGGGTGGSFGIISDFDTDNCDFRTGELTAACIPIFIGHLVQFVFSFIGVLFLLNIIVAGYQMMIASFQGNDLGTGKNRLIYSIIGFLVAACSFIIMDVILTVTVGG